MSPPMYVVVREETEISARKLEYPLTTVRLPCVFTNYTDAKTHSQILENIISL
jgi:hypothetical protein